MRFKHYVLILCACFCLLASVRGEQLPAPRELPETPSESLAGRQMMLPDALKGRPAVVIVGFSKSSQNSVKEWDTQARNNWRDVRCLSGRCARRCTAICQRNDHARDEGSTPAARQDHFLVVVKGEAELKKAADFSPADDAYVLLLDGAGAIRWRTHGSVSDAALRELQKQVEKLKGGA